MPTLIHCIKFNWTLLISGVHACSLLHVNNYIGILDDQTAPAKGACVWGGGGGGGKIMNIV